MSAKTTQLVAALSTWLWGLVSTGAFVWAMGKLRGNAATALTVLAGITASVFFRPLEATANP